MIRDGLIDPKYFYESPTTDIDAKVNRMGDR